MTLEVADAGLSLTVDGLAEFLGDLSAGRFRPGVVCADVLDEHGQRLIGPAELSRVATAFTRIPDHDVGVAEVQLGGVDASVDLDDTVALGESERCN